MQKKATWKGGSEFAGAMMDVHVKLSAYYNGKVTLSLRNYSVSVSGNLARDKAAVLSRSK